MLKNQAATITYLAWDTVAQAGKTGDASNHTIRGVGDGTEFTPAASPVEVDATHAPGLYKLALASGETNYADLTIGGASSTSGIVITPRFYSPDQNVPQTGDTFARIGTNGASLTAVGDARLAHLDADVSTRSTYAGGAVASVTGSVGSVTGSVGGPLGDARIANLDAPVSSRSTYAGGAVASVTSPVTISLSQTGLSPRGLDLVSDGALTVGDALVAAIAGAAGKQSVSGTIYTVETPHTGTAIRTFVLDSSSAPTTRT